MDTTPLCHEEAPHSYNTAALRLGSYPRERSVDLGARGEKLTLFLYCAYKGIFGPRSGSFSCLSDSSNIIFFRTQSASLSVFQWIASAPFVGSALPLTAGK